MNLLNRIRDRIHGTPEHQAMDWLADFCEEAPAIFYEPICHAKVKLLDEHAHLPERAHNSDAGWDITALYPARIPSGSSVIIQTGLAIAVPTGWCIKAYSRSGMSFQNDITLANSVGIIDAGYRGEIMVKLINHGKQPVEIEAGDKIAQLCFERVPQVILQHVDQLDATDRGTGGLGSSGR
ncbi:dUTP diphosphatase [Staphylococcus chromogenes]|nr:dUTP diphosphatase [Staphylococcus chromogenes]